MESTTTIAAIATPLGTGGIGVVRISGPHAFEVAEKVFRPYPTHPQVAQMSGYTAALGRIYDATGDLDDCILTVFRAPRSYTGEDVAELSCHGGIYLLRRVLRLCLEKGARLAGPGEFTRRAFLSGKLDLTQAEAVIDLIAAQSDGAARAALAARDGVLHKAIDSLCKRLLLQSSHLAAWSDYPEEEIQDVEAGSLLLVLEEILSGMDRLIESYENGKIARDGVVTAIVGRPNVGKSTLMNLLAGQQRSIVTPVPGTTRDLVEESVRVGDIILNLADTAGLRDTDDPVESIGVALARDKLAACGLILAVFDYSVPLAEEDMELLELCKGRPAVAVINKSDLPRILDVKAISAYITQTVTISAFTGAGAGDLRQAIGEVVSISQIEPGAPMVFSERQRNCLATAREALIQGIQALEAGITLDAVGVCLDCALDAMLELTGQKSTDAVVDQVFARFCVGK